LPTIQVKMKDLETLLGGSLTISELGNRLPLVKGEIKGYDEATGEIKLELNDTNRPDLWCVEGVARQIKTHRMKKAVPYPFYLGKRKAAAVIEVEPSLKTIRPYIGACIARGLTIDDETLVQLIQTQEKLSESFGRKRQLVSIGLYRLAKIIFPVSYKTVRPDGARLVPLGFDSAMTPAEILEKHPKGIAYAEILSKAPEYPWLSDREDRVLSFPPIINSREVGEVRVGDRDLFVEVTGTDLRMVILTVNILAANLSDRGAEIEPVEVRYPYPTDFGRKITLPMGLAKPLSLSLDHLTAALGEAVPMPKAVSVLKAYGYAVKTQGRTLRVSVPAYRDDLLHPVDVVEDFAISRGYETFEPEMPSEFTVGGLSAIERFSDRARESMIGMGFQEVISNILTNRDESLVRMNRSDASGNLITVENVMSKTYSALRDAIIPSLLRVEAASSKSFYPHRIFLAHPAANFSELHSGLDLLMYYLGRAYQLDPVVHPSFIEGRVGTIRVGGRDAGLIGELHPQVLENWQVAMPCTVLELNLDLLHSTIPPV